MHSTAPYSLCLPLLFTVVACQRPAAPPGRGPSGPEAAAAGPAVVAAAAPQPDGAAGAREAAAPAGRAAFRRELMARRYQMLAGADGTIADGAMARALRQYATAGAAAPATAGFSASGWRAGPGNLAGRMRALSIDPRTPAIMVAGAVSGGLWRSTDGGGTWTPVGDGLPSLAISSIVRSTATPDVLVAGTGEPFLLASGAAEPWVGANEMVRGAGIYRSTDNGLTWTQVAGTAGGVLDFVFRLAISTSDVIVAGTTAGMLRSTDLGLTWQPVAMGGGLSGAPAVLDVEFHPGNPALCAATFQWFTVSTVCERTATGGQIISQIQGWWSGVMNSGDGGATWSFGSGDGVTQLRPLRTFTNCNNVTFTAFPFPLRFEVRWHNNATYVLSEFGALFRRTTGTFQLVSTVPVGPQGFYDLALWVDPADTNTVTSDDVIVACGVAAFRSTNGGASFVQISDDMVAGSAHDDHHLVVEHPGLPTGQNRTVYLVTDGGIFRADDIGTVAIPGWVPRNSGLATTQFYGAARHADSGVLIGGTQDQGGLRSVDLAPFSEVVDATGVTLGDAGVAASDPVDGSVHYLCGMFPASVLRSLDGGNTVSSISAGIVDTANVIAPLVIDPSDRNRLYFGGRRLWRSLNPTAATPQWTPLTTAVGTNPPPIAAIAVAPGNSNVVWIGHNRGVGGSGVFFTLDGGQNWQQAGFARPARFLTRITVDPADANHVLITFGGFAANNLWEGNATTGVWQALNAPALPLYDAEFHPLDANCLLLATEAGVFATADRGANWSNVSPANVKAEELFWSRGHLYVATHGRGVFEQSPFAAAARQSFAAPCVLGGGAAAGPNLSTSLPILGTSATCTLSACTAGAVAMIVVGAPAPPPPFCGLLYDPNIAFTLGITVVGPGGTVAMAMALPPNPAFAGLPFVAQGGQLDNGVITVSNGVAWTVGF